MSVSKLRQDGLWLGVWLLSLLLVVVLSILLYAFSWIGICVPYSSGLECGTTLGELAYQAIEYLRISLVLYVAIGWIPAVYGLLNKYRARPRGNISAEMTRLYHFFLIIWLLAIPSTVAFSLAPYWIFHNPHCDTRILEKPEPCESPLDGNIVPSEIEDAQTTIAATPFIATYTLLGWIPVVLLRKTYNPNVQRRNI